MDTLIPNYRLIVTKKVGEDSKGYTTYGMEAVLQGEVLRRQEDISLCRNSVENLVEKCNRGALSILHFFDIIEDFLAE